MANIGFLLDMDGVIYRGSELIPGASEFVTRLRNLEIPFRYLTNNSQRARRDVALKLRRLGIHATEESKPTRMTSRKSAKNITTNSTSSNPR